MKVSLSCMDNMTKILNSKIIIKERSIIKDQANQNLCDCRNSDNCPLDNKCLTSKFILPK